MLCFNQRDMLLFVKINIFPILLHDSVFLMLACYAEYPMFLLPSEIHGFISDVFEEICKPSAKLVYVIFSQLVLEIAEFSH